MKFFRSTRKPRAKAGRKGSALLIVLGFLAFMVVSAVSFAVYMRTERLSSSGYRYSVSARHFCRAAFSRALSDLEKNIAPLGGEKQDYEFPGLQDHSNRWRGRVMLPGGTFVESAPDTVSSLALEGLGYLPPALINDARYWSRHTKTAEWVKLDFDVARCVYTVVNVSDMLDVNKVRPCARTSNPTNRVSIAYQWMSSDGRTIEGNGSPAENFGEEMQDRRGGSQQDVPFVSVMDYNVALGVKSSGWSSYRMVSPYYEYLKAGQGSSQGNTRFFYDGSGGGAKESANTLASAGRGWFMADSWNTNTWPRVSTTGARYANLAYAEGQPFKENAFKGSGAKSLVDVYDLMNETPGTPWRSAGSAVEIGTSGIKFSYEMASILYDYLDLDSSPVSLALPCTERAPMVSAFKLQTDGDGKIKVVPDKKESGSQEEKVEEYSLSLPEGPFGYIRGCAAIPFKHVSEFKMKSWEVEGFVRVWLDKNGEHGCRTPSENNPVGDPERYQAGGLARVNNEFDKASWSFRFADGKINLPDEIRKESDAFVNFTVRPKGGGGVDSVPYMRKTTRRERVGDSFQDKVEYECLLVGPDGKKIIDGKFDSSTSIAQALSQLGFRTAVWIAVKGSDGKYCDVVPACGEDDANYNEMAVSAGDDGRFVAFGSQHGFPQLYFPQSGSLDGQALVSSPQQFSFEYSWTGLQVADPRYNYAPENWCKYDGNIDSFAKEADGIPSLWNEYVGHDGRDPDIFMSVSDCTNLQSVAEFAMLPRFSGYSSAGRYQGGKFEKGSETDRDDFWRTFRLFEQGGKASDNLYSMNVVNMFEGAQRINPYSDLWPIRMALVQNTPYDWWSAGGGYTQDNKSADLKDALKYVFCPKGGIGDDARLSMADQTNIASRIFGTIRDSARDSRDWSWQSAFNALDWYSDGDTRQFLGVTLGNDSDDLHSVDKKFLYGFWRDCLGADQQLFLVFVRVEPTIIGGDTPGQTPAQLGTRAVGLVWREPRAPNKANGLNGPPHRMRVLFYHQFE